MSLTFRLFIGTAALALMVLATIMVPAAAMQAYLVYFILFYSILSLTLAAVIIPPKRGVALFRAIGIVILIAGAVSMIFNISRFI